MAEAGGAFPPSFGAPGSAFVYRPKRLDATRAVDDAPNLPITLPDAPMYMLFAHRQWRAGMLLSDLIYSRAFDLQGKYVLELGAGTGLPGITAALCGDAKKVVVTDYDDDSILTALRANVCRALEANPTVSPAPIVTLAHTWGHAMDDVLDALPFHNGAATAFDVLLLADCVWERFSHADLVKSIRTLLARTKDARVYMVAGLHTGRATLVHFIRMALAAGLHLVPVPGAWPALEAAPPTHLAGSDHILELEMDGALPEQGHPPVPPPGLRGTRRAFTLQDDEPVQVRNHWLTVSCFAWDSTKLA